MAHLSSSSSHRSSQMSTYSDTSDRAPSAQAQPPTPSLSPLNQAETAPVTTSFPAPQPDDWRYEAAVETVESIIKNIESGDMELAAIFDQFAIAVDHLHACETFLKQHRQQVDLLVETLSDEANF